MRQTKLGNTGPQVSQAGLGCMGMSGMYGAADRAESLATIHAAVDAGINLLDTGDFYGMGHNELLIGEALKTVARDKVLLSVKYGVLRDAGVGWSGYDTRPAATKNFLAYTLQRLGVDHIDIYRPARLDPAVPIEETVGGIADAVKAGYVRHIGLSEVSAATIRRAAAVHPIVDLQIEYSVLSRGIEDSILSTCRELGIAITAYGILSRGLISGSNPAGPGDLRALAPRFQSGNVEKNRALVEALSQVAATKGVSAAQLAIAWVAAQGADIVPLIGARKRSQLSESLGALDVALSPSDLAAIEAAVPTGAAAGGRYAAAQLAHLDSER
jgi:aryl-alcohol dehydrogenase-like predicted oxidoreductase